MVSNLLTGFQVKRSEVSLQELKQNNVFAVAISFNPLITAIRKYKIIHLNWLEIHEFTS